jgi:hypothetical protein
VLQLRTATLLFKAVGGVAATWLRREVTWRLVGDFCDTVSSRLCVLCERHKTVNTKVQVISSSGSSTLQLQHFVVVGRSFGRWPSTAGCEDTGCPDEGSSKQYHVPCVMQLRSCTCRPLAQDVRTQEVLTEDPPKNIMCHVSCSYDAARADLLHRM